MREYSKNGNSPDFPYVAEHIFAPVYPVLAARIVEESGIRKGTCLDLGCGIASLGIALAELTDLQIYGVDISGKMCRLSRNKACKSSLLTRVIPLQADVHGLPFGDSCADLIVSRGSVFFWKNLPLAFAEIARVLSSGGQAWIGGGFGTAELKKEISEIMVSKDPRWQAEAKERLSPETRRAIQAAGRKTGLACRTVQDGAGFWVVLNKGALSNRALSKGA